jgi:hypothetical protein
MTFEEKINDLSKIELTISHIYSYFSIKFSRSSSFWLQLSDEEKEHSFFFSSMSMAKGQMRKDFEEIIDNYASANDAFKRRLAFIDKYIRANEILEEEAFGIAFQIEYMVGEMAFQALIKKLENTELEKSLKKVYEDVVDHLDKLHDYTHEKQILVQQPAI